MTAGSSLVNTAQFRPFSYNEMLAPLAAYTNEYNTVQSGLSDLGTVADAYKKYIPDSSLAGQQLNAYNQKLNDIASDMAANGLSASTVNRDALYALKRDYNTNIFGINQAAQNLANLYSLVQKKQASDNSMMIGKMPTIDDMVSNPNSSPTYVSGNELYAHGVQAGNSASLRRFMQTETGKELMGQYFDIKSKTGYSQQDVEKFLQNASAFPELKEAMSNIGNMYNVGNLKKPDQIRAADFIFQGILNGLKYQETDQYPSNKQWDLNAQEQQMGYADTLRKGDMDYENELKKEDMLYQMKLKQIAAGGTSDNDEAFSNPESVMTNNGDYAKLLTGIKGTFNSTGSPLAAYYGKNGNVNPMKVYEAVHKAEGTVRWGMLGIAVPDKSAGSRIMRKYGVTRILTSDQYNAMKNLGYTSNSNMRGEGFKFSRYPSGMYKAMTSRIANLNTTNTINWLTNQDAIKGFGKDIYAGIAGAEKSGHNQGRVIKLDSNLNLTNHKGDTGDFDEKKNPITKIGTVSKYNGLVLQTADGQKWLANGSLADDVVSGILNNRSAYKKNLIAATRKLVGGRRLTPAELQAVDKRVEGHALRQIVEHKYRGFDQMLSPTEKSDKSGGSSSLFDSDSDNDSGF